MLAAFGDQGQDSIEVLGQQGPGRADVADDETGADQHVVVAGDRDRLRVELVQSLGLREDVAAAAAEHQSVFLKTSDIPSPVS
ncbi:hypothetical protein ACFV0W_42065 [Streptomyces anulatus]